MARARCATSPPGTWRQGVVWLAINSGASGKQGQRLDINREWREKWHMEYPILIDEKG
jgi:hypothetical protein